MAIWLIAITALIIVVVIFALPSTTPQERLESRFPPITDDEFVELCGPGTNRDVALRVRRIVAEQLGVEYDRIHPSCSFVNDLGCD